MFSLIGWVFLLILIYGSPIKSWLFKTSVFSNIFAQPGNSQLPNTQIDADGSGTIDFEEFVKIMNWPRLAGVVCPYFLLMYIFHTSKHTNVRWKSLFVEVEAEAEFIDQDGNIWCPYLAKEKQKDTSRFVFLPPQIWLDNVVRDFYLACTAWPRGGIGWHFSSSHILIHHCNYRCT